MICMGKVQPNREGNLLAHTSVQQVIECPMLDCSNVYHLFGPP